MPARDPSQILVYRYDHWDPNSNTRKTSEVYATIMAIRHGLGMPLFETEMWVSEKDVKGGIYTPNATTESSE